jgi:hypothetical protein
MMNNGSSQAGEFWLSEPPPDIRQPVETVPPEELAYGAEEGDESPAGIGDDFWLSEAPPDITQPVEPVEDSPDAKLAEGAAYAEMVATDETLYLKEPDYEEEVGDAEDTAREPAPAAQAALTNEELYRIIREVAVADSGEETYSAVSTDDDYGSAPGAGRQFGLAFGLVLFTQQSGRLGSVLRLMRRRDPETFNAIFGSDAEALLATTGARTPAERLQPVGGQPLWSDAWVSRFRRAGEVAAFQAAQNEEAIEGQFRPALRLATELGFTTDRGLAMVYDRVVVKGQGAGVRWVVREAGPLRTAAQRQHALSMLGFSDLGQFQATTNWVQPHGRFTPETHAALAGALRRGGSATLPSEDDMQWRLVRAATGAARFRLRRLLDSASFNDRAYTLQ